MGPKLSFRALEILKRRTIRRQSLKVDARAQGVKPTLQEQNRSVIAAIEAKMNKG